MKETDLWELLLSLAANETSLEETHTRILHLFSDLVNTLDCEAVSFAKWLRDNTVADGAPKLLFRTEMKRYTIEELYDLYTLMAD